MSNVPPLAVLITHTVSDYDQWKAAFDTHQAARKGAGVLGHHINRSASNPNEVSAYLPALDRQKLSAFMDRPDLKATMQTAGVTSPPTIVWLKPIDDAHVGDRPTAAMIVTHDVADFDTWKKVYDSVEPLRRKAGIFGASVNQSLDAPTKVIVYHQAATQAELEAFATSPELKAAMQSGGVTSPPQIRYMNSLPGAAY